MEAEGRFDKPVVPAYESMTQGSEGHKQDRESKKRKRRKKSVTSDTPILQETPKPEENTDEKLSDKLLGKSKSPRKEEVTTREPEEESDKKPVAEETDVLGFTESNEDRDEKEDDEAGAGDMVTIELDEEVIWEVSLRGDTEPKLTPHKQELPAPQEENAEEPPTAYTEKVPPVELPDSENNIIEDPVVESEVLPEIERQEVVTTPAPARAETAVTPSPARSAGPELPPPVIMSVRETPDVETPRTTPVYGESPEPARREHREIKRRARREKRRLRRLEKSHEKLSRSVRVSRREQEKKLDTITSRENEHDKTQRLDVRRHDARLDHLEQYQQEELASRKNVERHLQSDKQLLRPTPDISPRDESAISQIVEQLNSPVEANPAVYYHPVSLLETEGNEPIEVPVPINSRASLETKPALNEKPRVIESTGSITESRIYSPTFPDLPPEAREIAERLAIPEGHELQHSSWHTIEVDKQTGRAVEEPVMEYGKEFYREQHQEAWHPAAAGMEAIASQTAQVGSVKDVGYLSVPNSGTYFNPLQNSAPSPSPTPYAPPVQTLREVHNNLSGVGNLALVVVLIIIITAIILEIT
jgi:hypothetical protein